MDSRGYDPAQGDTQNISVPLQNETTPGASAPTVEPTDAQTTGPRGADAPIARPGDVSGQTTARPSGVTVTPTDARVRGRGDDQPIVQ